MQARYADQKPTSGTGRQTRGQRNEAIQQKRQGTVTASGSYHKLEDQQFHKDNRHVLPRQPRKEEDRPTAHCQIQPKKGKPGMRKTGPRHTTSINPKGCPGWNRDCKPGKGWVPWIKQEPDGRECDIPTARLPLPKYLRPCRSTPASGATDNRLPRRGRDMTPTSENLALA